MINSRDKGARFERTLASMFRLYGYDAHRTAQYCGNTGCAADVVGLPGIHVEAKCCEKMKMYDWIAQAKHDSANSVNLPAVFSKRNGDKILVTMEMEDWFKLYTSWELERNGEDDLK